MKKFGLALGVGGARGFAHLGVLEVLEENGITPDLIVGGSMGALVGGVYALEGNINNVRELVDKYRRKDLYDVSIVAAATESGVSSDKQFYKTVYEATKGKNIEDCHIKFYASSCDLVTGEQYVFDKGPMWHAIRASCSIPGVLPTVAHEGKVLVDGGLLNRVPTDLARSLGAEVVLGVDAIGKLPREWKPKTFVSVMRRAFEAVDEFIFNGHDHQCDIMITPEQMNLDAMKFTAKNKATSILAGRKAMSDVVDKLKELLAD